MTELKFGFVISDQPVEYYLEFAERNGLGHLEIDLLKEHSLLESFTDKRAANLKAEAGKHHVRLSLYSRRALNLVGKDRALADAEAGYVIKCIELAKKLDAEFVTTCIGSVESQKHFASACKSAMARVIRNLQRVVQVCEKQEMRLALANSNLMPKGSELFYLGDRIKDFSLLFSKIKSPYLNFCLDLGHAHTNEGIPKYIEKLGGKIINVHYHDNDGTKDEHLNVGDGSINWKQVMRLFKKIGYWGPFLSETKDSPVISMRKLLRYIAGSNG